MSKRILVGPAVVVVIMLFPALWLSTREDGQHEGEGLNAGVLLEGTHRGLGVQPRKTDPANVRSPHSAGISEPILEEPGPPTSSPFRGAFEAQLLRGAAANGKATPQEACLEWSRIIPLALAKDASEAETVVGLINVADACTRAASPTDADLRLAHEALERWFERDPGARDRLDAFVEKHPEERGLRSYLLFVDQHPEDTVVKLDGRYACREPCTLAVPIDGDSHSIDFVGRDGGTAEMTWTPLSLQDNPPDLPVLGR